MCDSSSQVNASSAPNVVVSAASGILPYGGKQLAMDTSMPNTSNSANNNFSNNGQSFLNGLLPAAAAALIQHDQQQHNQSTGPVYGHNLGNAGMNSQYQQQHRLQQQQQQSQPLPSMHHPIMPSMQGNHYSTMQQHLMENPHHLQQMNLPYQQGAHQVPHLNSLLHSRQHHPQGQQQYNIPFGMNLNANNIGPANTYSNQQIYPFYPHGAQIPNQQPAHSMNASVNPLQHQSSFMQQAACMPFQQNPPALTPINPQRAPVGWMNGQKTSRQVSNQNANMTTNQNANLTTNQNANLTTNQNANLTTNQNSNFNTSASVPMQHEGTKRMSVSASKSKSATGSDPMASLPGGIEVLWREVSVECRNLMTPHDIPDTARTRGYFTVCELLVLKRLLKARYEESIRPVPSCPPLLPIYPQEPLKKVAVGAVNKPEGAGRKRKRGSNKGKSRAPNKISNVVKENANNSQSNQDTTINYRNDNNNSLPNCNAEMMQEETDENSVTSNEELMINLDSIRQEIRTSSVPAVTGVGIGGAVKDAMVPNSSTTTDQHASGNNQIFSGTNKADITMLTNNRSDSPQLIINENVNSSNTGAAMGAPCQPGLAGYTNTVNINPSGQPYGGGESYQPQPGSSEGRFCEPSAPYRTKTLVLKLLQIGVYHVRSFSNVNPNQLRVLFNTQRLTYECHLPIIQPPNVGPSSRKVLTIDFGFEQISMMKFGPNSLLMRVEGAPIVTIAVNPSQEDNTNDVLGPHDTFLLDQIEKGQLKLSPIHQLHFINERLVSLLESQFRLHPRIGSLLTDEN